MRGHQQQQSLQDLGEQIVQCVTSVLQVLVWPIGGHAQVPPVFPCRYGEEENVSINKIHRI